VHFTHGNGSGTNAALISVAVHAGVILGALGAAPVLQSTHGASPDTLMIWTGSQIDHTESPGVGNPIPVSVPAPIDVPTTVPIDVSGIPTLTVGVAIDPRDLIRGSILTGSSLFPGDGSHGTLLDSTFLAGEVDVPPALAEGSSCAPEYPRSLRLAGIPGRVVLRFVVNEDGSVDRGSLRVIQASHTLFEQPAMDGLKRSSCRFTPGKKRGISVRVLVQQAAVFRLEA
jgi:TonB family protein